VLLVRSPDVPSMIFACGKKEGSGLKY